MAEDGLQWDRIAEELREVRAKFGAKTPCGARRTAFAEAGEVAEVPIEAMIEREPITVVCSKMGWIRAMKGHIDLGTEMKFRDGDEGRFLFHAETTDKLLVFSSAGRFYTLSAAGLPGGRGLGEPLRLMVDLPNEAEIVTLFTHRADGKLLVASSAGDGFLVAEADVVAQTRAGKQVLNLGAGVTAQVCVAVRRAMMRSRWWARTASFWFLPWTSCPRWVVARACGCRNTRMAVWPMRAALRARRGCRGLIPRVGHGPRPIWRNGTASALRPGRWHRAAFRATIALPETSPGG